MLAIMATLPAVLATRPAIPPTVLIALTTFPSDSFSDGRRDAGELNDNASFTGDAGIAG